MLVTSVASRWQRFEDGFLSANRWALIITLAVMAIIIFANVMLRYLTNHSIEWAEEVARHLMIWLTFLGCGPVLRYGGHIAVENFQDALPTKLALALRGLVVLLLIGFFVFMLWWGVDYMNRTQYQLTPATQISFRWIYLGLPVGAALSLVHLALIARPYILRREFASDAHFDATASASL